MGIIVPFDERARQAERSLRHLSQSDLQAHLDRDIERIEAATSSCETLMACINELQESLKHLERLKFTLPEASDRQVVEMQLTSTRSMLVSHVSALADISRKLTCAAELASQFSDTRQARSRQPASADSVSAL